MASGDLGGVGVSRRAALVTDRPDRQDPVFNDRGVIAENYHELQGLGVLAAARRSHPLPKASAESTLRAVFQAVEIALLNLADVVGRAASISRTAIREPLS